MALNPKTSVLARRRVVMQTHTQERRPWEAESIDWNYVAINQGILRIARSPPEA